MKLVAIPGLAQRAVEDAWPEFDVETAQRELKQAGWRPRHMGVWQSPRGSLFYGPALAWKLMRKYGDRC